MSYAEEYLTLIESWHNAANTGRFSDVDYFSKFMFEYFSFITFISTQLYPGKREGTAVSQLKENSYIKEKYLLLIVSDNELKENWLTIKRELDSMPLMNSSLRNRSNSHQNGLKLNDMEDWNAMVEFWRCIRNNLFHGTKGPNISRDRFLVEYGYKTLSKFIDLILIGQINENK